jgi:hypothetical protein
MNKAIIVLVIVLLIGWLVTYLTNAPPEYSIPTERIVIHAPLPESTIVAPLHISGEANADWFVEGPIQIILTNWDGLIIAEAEVEQGGTQTDGALVTFETDLFFEKPDYNNRGTLIIQKANPTRDPAKAEAREMTLFFE